MMYDHHAITLNTVKSTPNLAYLTPTSTNTRGWAWYVLEGVHPMQVGYSASRQELIVKGSPAYFSQGHNAAHSLEDLRKGWTYIGGLLNVNPFLGYVTQFEFGAIISMPYPVAVALQHHTRLTGFETHFHYSKSSILKGVDFHSSSLKVKLYDPIANYQAKRLSKAAYMAQLGLLPGANYLRIENQYRKPECHFKARVLLTDLFNPTFQQLCKTDLMETYGRIKKTKAVALPDDKSKLSTGNLILATLKRVAQETGSNAEEMVYNTLSGIPEDVLSKEDRKARKRQFKKMLSEVSSTEPSPYDLSELLKRKLYSVEYP